MSELAERKTAVAPRDEKAPNPFRWIPVDWIPVVSAFAETKSSVLKSAGPLCGHLNLWIKMGLTLDDVKRIFNRLCRPEIVRGHSYENQLMADLAGLVADCLHRRRMLDEARKRREPAPTLDGIAGQVAKLADHFAMPGGKG